LFLLLFLTTPLYPILIWYQWTCWLWLPPGPWRSSVYGMQQYMVACTPSHFHPFLTHSEPVEAEGMSYM
jgi:hypothetical protein